MYGVSSLLSLFCMWLSSFQCTDLSYLWLKVFLFEIIVNETVFLASFSDCLMLKVAINFVTAGQWGCGQLCSEQEKGQRDGKADNGRVRKPTSCSGQSA